jgi:hypothetical protein
MRDRTLCLVLSMLLAGCGGGGGGGGGGASTAAGATAGSVVVQGRVSGDPDGALVHLLGPTTGAPTLRTLGEAVLDSAEVARDGAFALRATEPGPYQVLVSAPGRALTWAEVSAGALVEVAPAPEARLTLEALDGAGRPEPFCLALVLDASGRPLPLVPAEVVTDEGGRLSAGRLPAGRLEVLVLSGDLARAARTSIDVREDEVAVVTVRLDDDPALLARALRVAGQDELASVIEGVSR